MCDTVNVYSGPANGCNDFETGKKIFQTQTMKAIDSGRFWVTEDTLVDSTFSLSSISN